MSRRRISLIWLFLSAGIGLAQEATEQPATPDSPECTSYALDNDRTFTGKQHLCYFVQKELFSMTSLGGAVFGANYSQWTQKAGDLRKGTPGFATRFATNYGQSAMKSGAQYLSRFILHEDARRRPPYVEPRPPRRFFKRVGYAVADNFIAYKCADPCEPDRSGDPDNNPYYNLYHYKKTFALSRVVGSIAGAYSSMVWAPDRLNTPGRALRRVSTTYAGTFGGSFTLEFKPELAIGVGKLIGWIAGAR